MAIKIRRNDNRYELYSSRDGSVLKNGLKAEQVYLHLVLPQLRETLKAIGRWMEEADREYERAVSDTGDSGFEEAIEEDLVITDQAESDITLQSLDEIDLPMPDEGQ